MQNSVDYTLSEKHYGTEGSSGTTFLYTRNNIFLKKLFDFSCNMAGKEEWTSERTADNTGMVLLDTSIGRFEGNSLRMVEAKFNDSGVNLSWTTPGNELLVESSWKFNSKTGVWSRKDQVICKSDTEISIYRLLARFVFIPGEYELYSQNSRWIYENQGSWEKLSHGSRTLGCRRGRTCQNATPFIALREKSCKNGVAFHQIPTGNWTFKIDVRPISNNEFSFIIIEMGLEDENMNYRLLPGDCLESPEMLYHIVLEGDIENGAPILQQHIMSNTFQPSRFPAPMVYNTWIDDFDNFKIERLRKHIKAAKKVGCEVFVVDAGWFGEGDNWWEDVGDWREKKDTAFFGNLTGFADEVRVAGLGFGLWMEPERVAPKTPVFLAHPEWFSYGSQGFYYPKLYNSEVYSHFFNEICRLLDIYKVVWLKIDFNFELGIDPTGAEFYNYYRCWYKMLDELRTKYKNVYFEGCSSGGMRTDLNTVSRFDGHFLTDTVNPFYVLRITQGAMLRLPPGRLSKWVSLRNYERTRLYDNEVRLFPENLMTSKYCCWDEIINTNLDFAARVMMTGMFGITGDISNLPESIMVRLAFHISYYKKWRSFIADSIGYLLTPIEPRNNENGWAAIQLQNEGSTKSLVFIYRLKDMNTTRRIYLQDLNSTMKYRVIEADVPNAESVIMDGCYLMTEGLDVEISTINNAVIYEVIPL